MPTSDRSAVSVSAARAAAWPPAKERSRRRHRCHPGQPANAARRPTGRRRRRVRTPVLASCNFLLRRRHASATAAERRSGKTLVIAKHVRVVLRHETQTALVAGDRSTARTYRISLQTGRRSRLPALRIPVHDAAGGFLGGHSFVVGGGNASEQSAVQQFGRTRGWTTVTNLPQPRSDLVAVTIHHRLVVLGGFDGTMSQRSIVALSPGGHVSVVGALGIAVRYPAVAVADGAVWLFGGEHDGHLASAIQRVDIESWRSRVVGHLGQPLGHSAAVILDGQILLVGGRTGPSTVTSQMWWFNPNVSSLRRAGRLPYPLSDAGAVTASGAAYLLGGETPKPTKRVVRLTARP